jgi:hypothetical protein
MVPLGLLSRSLISRLKLFPNPKQAPALLIGSSHLVRLIVVLAPLIGEEIPVKFSPVELLLPST